MSLLVLEPGPCSLVVDLGRPKHRSLGVPMGGAADRAALMQGNALVGNDPGAAALEFALAGPTLESATDLGCVVFGAPIQVDVNGKGVSAGTTFNLHQGNVLKIGTTSVGMRAYLCVRGGLQAKEILGSQSGLEPLNKGDRLRCKASTIGFRSLAEPIMSTMNSNEVVTLRVIDGPQADWFDVDQFSSSIFSVSPSSNRMGMRLQGPALDRPQKELVSEAVCPGAIQVVNDGQCIILGVDGQTIGGYPKIATVISADLDVLGQLRPGQRVRFERVTLEQAESLLQQRNQRLKENLLRLAVAV
jgi:5-oxoprolinase (ATP-hydrolysing) subunit C